MPTALLLQAAAAPQGDWVDRVLAFIDTPAPFSPLTEYLVVLFLLWLLAKRQERRKSIDAQAQEVLDQKLADGELSQDAYEKYRQDLSLRPRR